MAAACLPPPEPFSFALIPCLSTSSLSSLLVLIALESEEMEVVFVTLFLLKGQDCIQIHLIPQTLWTSS